MKPELCAICGLTYEGGKHTYIEGKGIFPPGGHYFEETNNEEE